mmetsp:Transcript_100072/g.172738  ORF Transcript_100072/g.172738 Transcript_100072/m.172738 type:complete len:101 (+) Transcript_100072:2972-3274(+)
MWCQRTAVESGGQVSGTCPWSPPPSPLRPTPAGDKCQVRQSADPGKLWIVGWNPDQGSVDLHCGSGTGHLPTACLTYVEREAEAVGGAHPGREPEPSGKR